MRAAQPARSDKLAFRSKLTYDMYYLADFNGCRYSTTCTPLLSFALYPLLQSCNLTSHSYSIQQQLYRLVEWNRYNGQMYNRYTVRTYYTPSRKVNCSFDDARCTQKNRVIIIACMCLSVCLSAAKVLNEKMIDMEFWVSLLLFFLLHLLTYLLTLFNIFLEDHISDDLFSFIS